MKKIFGTMFILGILALIVGSLLLCFEATAFLFPFTVTLMLVGGGCGFLGGMLWVMVPLIEED